MTTQASSGISADRGRPAGGLAPCLPSGRRRERPIALNKLDGAEAARAEFCAALFQVVEQGNQVAQAVAKPVELPNNQRVAGLELVQATEQGRALYDDVDALLENGFNIVNRYSVAFFDSSHLPKIVGADDYLKVLRTLQNHEEAVEARLREEMPRAEGAQ